jgi:hypothetical protein
MAEVHYKDFYAICNHMPGADRAIRVGGSVEVPTSNWSAYLEPRPNGINQFMLHLNLVLTPPDQGALDVVQWIEVDEWREESPALEYKEVEFHVSDPDYSPPPPVIEVQHPERT